MKMSGKEFLESLQRDAGTRGLKSMYGKVYTEDYVSGNITEKQIQDAFKASLWTKNAGHIKKQKEAKNRILELQNSVTFSSLEKPHYYMLLNDVLSDLYSTLLDEKGLELENIAIGTLPSSELNASAWFLTKDGDRVITVNIGLLQSYFVTLKIFSSFFSYKKKLFGGIRIKFEEEEFYRLIGNYSYGRDPYIDTFIEMMSIYPIEGKITQLPYFKVPKKNYAFVNLSSGCDFFVVGHELGHVVLEHNKLEDYERIHDDIISFIKKSYSVEYGVATKWAIEMEADIFAIHGMLKGWRAQKATPTILLTGAIHVLSLLEFQQKVYETDLGNYPPFSLRKDWIKHYFLQNSSKKHSNLGPSDWIKTIFDELYNEVSWIIKDNISKMAEQL